LSPFLFTDTSTTEIYTLSLHDALPICDLKTFSDTDFESGVLKSDKPVLVDFYADWCGPCKMMAPVVEQVASQFSDQLTVGKLVRSEEHTSELQSLRHLVCRLLLEKKKK